MKTFIIISLVIFAVIVISIIGYNHWGWFANTKIKDSNANSSSGKTTLTQSYVTGPSVSDPNARTTNNQHGSENERWVITCAKSPSNVCCYASTQSGSIVSSVFCNSFRLSNNQYINMALIEAQKKLRSYMPN